MSETREQNQQAMHMQSFICGRPRFHPWYNIIFWVPPGLISKHRAVSIPQQMTAVVQETITKNQNALKYEYVLRRANIEHAREASYETNYCD